jgi:hypothetical protein
MAITIIKLIILFCFLILPLTGPSKRRGKISRNDPDKTLIHSSYGINENGELEELINNKD